MMRRPRRGAALALPSTPAGVAGTAAQTAIHGEKEGAAGSTKLEGALEDDETMTRASTLTALPPDSVGRRRW